MNNSIQIFINQNITLFKMTISALDKLGRERAEDFIVKALEQLDSKSPGCYHSAEGIALTANMLSWDFMYELLQDSSKRVNKQESYCENHSPFTGKNIRRLLNRELSGLVDEIKYADAHSEKIIQYLYRIKQ